MASRGQLSDGDSNNSFHMMQHLMTEMDRSNRRIDHMTNEVPRHPQFDTLYDEAWKSEESDGASLQEVPLSAEGRSSINDSGCEEAVNDAIAEVSKDYLSGQKATYVPLESDESRLSSDSEFKLITGFPSYARYPENGAGSDTDWNPYGTESDTNASPHLHDNSDKVDCNTISFNPPFHSTDLNINTPSFAVGRDRDTFSSRYISTNTGTAGFSLKPDDTHDYSSISHISDRTGTSSPVRLAKDVARFETDLNQSMRGQELLPRRGLEKNSNNGENQCYMPVGDRARLLRVPEEKTKGRNGDFSDEDALGRKVEMVLTKTQHLDPRGVSSQKSPSLDYNMLQRDLQDIQDSLHRTLGTDIVPTRENATVSNRQDKRTPVSSDNDGEIIPSTTTTPERRNDKMSWDFAADLGYAHPEGLMTEISLDTYRSSSNRPSTDNNKASYNSDGNDTHTSHTSGSSSTKLDDHAAADQALADMSEILQPAPGGAMHSQRDVDAVLDSFRNQRHQLETRYEQLNNHNLSEKVYRILTNQGPESQANGILSNVSAEERDTRTRFALGLKKDDLSFSGNPNDSGQKIGLPDDVRRRLDLSGLSMDSSGAFSFSEPPPKGFTAFDDMTRFLSSQMQKITERNFNHSIEMRVPPHSQQTVTCYPLTVEYDGQGGARGGHPGGEADSGRTTQSTEISDSSQDKQKDPYTDPPVRSSPSPTSPTLPSPNDSDNSGHQAREKLRPYRPHGSKEVYYTAESDTASVADSVTTIESTHIGSDDARGPSLPSSALGSRREAPRDVAGIYSHRGALSPVTEISTLPDKPGADEKVTTTTEYYVIDPKTNRRTAAYGHHDQQQVTSAGDSDQTAVKTSGTDKAYDRDAKHSQLSAIENARRKARWENMMHDRDQQDKADADQGGQSRSNQGQGERSRSTQSQEERSRSTQSQGQRFLSNLDEQTRAQSDRDTRGRSDVSDSDYKLIGTTSGTQQPYSLPSNAFVSSHETHGNTEPLSLRIRMSYEDTNGSNIANQREEQKSRIPEDFLPIAPGTKSYSIPVRRQYESEDTYQSRMGLTSPVNFRSSGDTNSPPTTRHARISPAFRRALSPDLRTAIESRSPLLSREIDDCLAQPPALQPDSRASNRETRREPPPPTFLARERVYSPTFQLRQRATSPTPRVERSMSPVSRPRDRSASPTSRLDEARVSLARRARERSLSPTIRRNERRASPTRGAADHSVSPRRRETAMDPPSPLTLRAKSYEDRARAILERDPSMSRNAEHRGKRPLAFSPKRSAVECTMEGMTSDTSVDTELDHAPISKRAQLLTRALRVNDQSDIRPDINAMWEQFKSMNDDYESSMNSGRMDAVSDLLKNPTHHMLQSYLHEREQYRVERKERSEEDRERRLREQRDLHNTRSSSDDDHAYTQAKKEEERQKRRAGKKKKGKLGDSGRDRQGETRKDRGQDENAENAENIPDSLFSIPEEHSPVKGNAPKLSTPSKAKKSKPKRTENVIDPNMNKLRSKIASQRQKMDKQAMREMKRLDKLNTLEGLLASKQRGDISDATLEAQLEDMSSTTSRTSDNSVEGVKGQGQPSDDSTTAKDDSAEMWRWKAEKEARIKDMKARTERQRLSDREMKAERQRLNEIKMLKMTKERSNREAKNKGDNTKDVSSTKESSLKLLRLVKEGYLSPQEAYRLALEREQSQTGAEGGDSTSPDTSFSDKPHKQYSPYGRDTSTNNNTYRPSHKMKQPHANHSSLPGPKKLAWADENDSNDAEEGRSSRGLTRPTSTSASYRASRSPGARGQGRSVISVPESSRRQRGNTAKSASPSSRFGGNTVGRRPRSVSPGAGRGATLRGALSPWRQAKVAAPQMTEPPPSASVAWSIPMDKHPSLWREPTVASLGKTRVKMADTREGKMEGRREGKMEGRREMRLPLREQNVDLSQSFLSMDESSSSPEPLTSSQLEPPPSIWAPRQHHPAGTTAETWAHTSRHDALATKVNHWEVDPLMDRVQYILNKPDPEAEAMDKPLWQELKPYQDMTLQDAFMARKQGFISHCKERQKRLVLSNENRRMQECLRLERDAIFAEHDRLMAPNLHAHPYSDNLFHPKRRVLTKNEMKELTVRKYKKLPEVVEKKENDKKNDERKINRLRARLFNKKVQKESLKKMINGQC